MGFFADNFDTLFSQQPVPASEVVPGGPLIPNLPRSRTAFSNKVTKFYDPAEARGDWGPGTIQALKKIDDARVLRGQMPMSREETSAALRAAQPTPDEPLSHAITERPEGWSPTDIPGDIVSDTKAFFTGLPQLPGALLHQVQDLPNLDQRIKEAIADPSKRGNVPLLGLIPGATTAASAAAGDWESIVKHPLMTALDVLPYTKARVFAAPESWAKEGARVAAESGDLGIVAGATKPRSLYQELFPETRYTAREVRRMQGITARGETGKANIMDLISDTGVGRRLAKERDILRVKARGTNAGSEIAAGTFKEIRSLMNAKEQIQRGIFDVIADANSPVMKTMMGDRFATYSPAIKAYQKLHNDFGPEFARANYGSPEAWVARKGELTDILEKRPDEIPGLPEHERAFIEQAQDVNDKLIEPRTSDNPARPTMFGRVTVDLPDGTTHQLTTDWKSAKKIWDQQEKHAMFQDTQWLHDAVDNPGQWTADEILAHAGQSKILSSPAVSVASKINVIEGYVHALNSIGQDARPLLKDIRKARFGQVPGEVLRWLNETEFNQLDGRIPVEIGEIADTLKFRNKRGQVQYTRGKVMAAPDMVALKTQMRMFERGGFTAKQLTDFRKLLIDTHLKATAGRFDAPDTFKALDMDKALDTIDILRRRTNWQQTKRTVELLGDEYSGALTEAEKLIGKTPDQRLVPLLQQQAHESMIAYAQEINDTLNAGGQLSDDLVARVADRQYEALAPYLDENVSVKKLWKGFAKEANESWRQLAVDLGPDNLPRFVHHVPAEKAESSQFINVTLGSKNPSAWKKRSLDLAPYSKDLQLAAHTNVIDHLVKQGDDYLLDIIQNGDPSQGWTPWVQTQGTLLEKMRPLIERERRLHPETDYDVIAERLLKRTYTQVDMHPTKKLVINEDGLRGYASGAKDKVKFGIANSEQQWMPRNMARAVQQMRTPMKARAVWDPIMSTFRTSALILSPRWQVYNILGNGFLGIMSHGWDFLAEMPKAYDNLRKIRRYEEGVTLNPNLRTSLAGSQPAELVLEDLAKGGWKGTAELGGPAGKSAYSAWKKTGVPEGFSKIKHWSIGMNAYFDDLSRIASYLAGEKQVTKLMGKPGVTEAFERQAQQLGESAGLKKEVVDRDYWEDPDTGQIHESEIKARPVPSHGEMTHAEAENLMLETTYNWSNMTPWERSTARNIFPFYGFYSHILRYASRYAYDHPFKVAIFAGFARSELEDWGTGLPERIHDYFLLNRDRDEQGNVLGVNMKGWSPFAQTADLFTISGWVNQVNPLLSTLMQQFGVDPRTGEASTYPATAFDPETGRLALAKPDLATSLVQSVIPQTQGVAALLGLGDQEQRRLNPDAYAAGIRSAFGIPSFTRQINVPQEIAYSEAAALNARKQAESEAYRSGGTPSAYPVLAAEVTKRRTLQSLSPSTVAQFTPPSTAPGILDLVKRAVVPGG